VIENIGASFNHAFQRRFAVDEVRREDFRGSAGLFTHSDDTTIEVIGTAIRQIISGDTGDHDMLET
jgi:hypothetical protein